MKRVYKSAFIKFVKKQRRPLQLAIEDETDVVLGNPEVGEVETGDLAGFRVHKFKFQKQEYLLAYRMETDTLTFFMAGTHENFYQKLKRYIKEAGI